MSGGERAGAAPDISVVVPVYNSEACLDELAARVRAAFASLGRPGELILVDDGSRDGSWARAAALARAYPEVRALRLRRNFGQDNAIMAGLGAARGAVVVVMDDDLQHDPADIGRLVAVVEGGRDVCYASFARKRQAWWKNLGSRLNGAMATWLLGKPRGLYLSPYKAIARDVVREIVRYTGPYPYVDGLILRVTRDLAEIPATHHPRHAGRSNYTLARAISVWLKAATNFSVAPVRLATLLGFASSAVGFLLGLYYIGLAAAGVPTPSGWYTLVVCMLFLGGVQLVALGVIGEYVGRTFLMESGAPQYVVRERVGDPPGAAARAEERGEAAPPEAAPAGASRAAGGEGR